jgi:hypothetical protein
MRLNSSDDQHRLLRGVALFDLLDDRVVFLAPRLVDAVVGILARHRAVGRDDDHVEPVNVVEFVGLRLGRARHAGQLFVEAEIILDGDGGQRLGLAVDLHAFLGLDRLMQTVAPAAPRHFAAGELVDDEDFVVLDDVFDVFLVEAVGLEELRDVVDPLGLRVEVLLLRGLGPDLVLVAQRRVQVDVGEFVDQVRQDKGIRIVRVHERAPFLREVRFVLPLLDRVIKLLFQRDERFFVGVLVEGQLGLVEEPAHLGLFHQPQQAFVARFAEFDFEQGAPGLLLFALFQQLLHLGDETVAEHRLLADELVDQRLEAVVLVRRNGRRTADDERRAGLVDEDGIHLVDDGEVVSALHLLLFRRGHAVVAQVIEAELAVRAVGYVAGVLRPADVRRLVVLDDPDGQPEKTVNLADPLGVAAGQIIVDRDQVRAASGQRVQIKRQGRDQRLAFARGHFGDAAAVQDHAADQLDVEVDHLPLDGMTDHRDGAAAEAAGRVFDHGERLGQDPVERLLLLLVVADGRQARLPPSRLGPEVVVGQRLVLLLEFVDLAHDRQHALDLALILRADDFPDDEIDHASRRTGPGKTPDYPPGGPPQRKSDSVGACPGGPDA